MRLVKLRLRAPLHVGSSTLGEEDTHDYVPSDTLFSALCHAYLDLYGKDALEGLLARFQTDPPFAISSAFPFSGDTLFAPVPRLPPPERARDRRDGERPKKASWVSVQTFCALLSGEDAGDPEHFARRLPRRQLLPRVALDRESSGSAIYHVRRAVFPDGGGVWFLLDPRKEGVEREITATLRLLGDTGLGGERSTGCGRFEPEVGEVPEPLAGHLRGGPPYIALSRVHPREEDLQSVEHYGLVQSKGWLSSPTGMQRKRRSLWFFSEGSSFKEPAAGCVVDVAPDNDLGHRVYRYGLGLYAGSA